MTVNKELLRETMDAILAHPEKHDQSNWATETDCGTAYCFAGWVCHLSGLQFDFAAGFERDTGDGIERTTGFLDGGFCVETEARDLLGLDYATGACLFEPDNTTADLKHFVDEIAEHGLIRAAQDPWVQT
jgi:hypothetical protein